MAIENYTRQLMAVILNLVQLEVETFDPPTRKPYPRTKLEVDRMTLCRYMVIVRLSASVPIVIHHLTHSPSPDHP